MDYLYYKPRIYISIFEHQFNHFYPIFYEFNNE